MSTKETMITKEEYAIFTAPYERALEHALTSIGDFKKELELQSDNLMMIDTPLYRVKEYESTIRKCQKKTGKKIITAKDIKNNIKDIAAMRLVTGVVDDIYAIRDAIKSRLRMNVIEEKNYIGKEDEEDEKDYASKAKESGYRSLHLIVQRELYFNNRIYVVPIEIQIRTFVMDTWSRYDHIFRYKTKIQAVCPELEEEFHKFFLRTVEDDIAVAAIRKRYEELTKNPPD